MKSKNANTCARARRSAICTESRGASSHLCGTCSAPSILMPTLQRLGVNDHIASICDPTCDARGPTGHDERHNVKTPARARVFILLALLAWMRSSVLLGSLVIGLLPTPALASETTASFQVGLRILPARPQAPPAAMVVREPVSRPATTQPVQAPPLPTVTMRWLRADETGNASARFMPAYTRQSDVQRLPQDAPIAH